MPRITDIRNAPSPIMGGNSWLPVEARTSMAPASLRVKPVRTMVGMVMLPESAILLTD